MRLTRKAIEQGLDTVPISEILNVSTLTTKQKRFAKEVALGSTKAEAYRRAYSPKAKAKTAGDAGYKLSNHSCINQEIQAYKLAIEGQKHRTPEALRQLVIKTLVDVAINPDTKDSVKVQAVKVLGTVVEVGAFLERREVINTTNSAQAKETLMKEIRNLITGSAVDAVEIDADSLLRELVPAEPHPTATPHDGEEESLADKHTIPLKGTPEFLDTPHAKFEEDPPGV